MGKFSVRPACRRDERAIKNLLERSDLPFDDLDFDRQRFLLALANDEIVGAVGLEAYGENGLLRSVAVEEELRGHGLGSELVEEMIEKARSTGVRELYLLTMTAAPFFARHDFERTDRSMAPAPLQGTTEFASLCPVSSVCMRKRL